MKVMKSTMDTKWCMLGWYWFGSAVFLISALLVSSLCVHEWQTKHMLVLPWQCRSQ